MGKKTRKQLLTVTAHWYMRDHVAERSAALAYYLLLSLIPLVSGLLLAGAFFFGPQGEAITGQYAAELFGERVVSTITTLFTIQGGTAAQTSIFALLGFFVLLYGASQVFYRLQNALYAIFNFSIEDETPLKKTIRERLTALVYMIILYLFVMVLVLIYASTLLLLHGTNAQAESVTLVGRVTSTLLLFFLATSLFTIVYRFVSYRSISWFQSLYGGATAAFLLGILNIAFSVFVLIVDGERGLSGAGSLVGFLFWAYFFMQCVLLGAVVAKISRIVART